MKYACWQSQLKAAWKNFTRDWELLHVFVFNWKPNKLEVASSFSHLLRCGRGMWDPSSLMRDRIHSHLALEVQSLNHKSWAWEFLDRNACVCACVCVRVRLFTQSCLILCDLMDCSPPGSSIHGHFQARALEWVSSVLFSLSVVSDSLRPHELQHARPPCPSPTPGVHSNSCPLSRGCSPTISSFVVPSPPAFNLSQHQGLFQRVSSWHQMAKVLEL